MLGAKVSTGFVVSLVASPVVHVDETTDQVRTDTWWFHVASSDLYTLLFASATRGKAAPDAAGVLGEFAGVMVHDRLAMYFKYKGATHLICGAHLVRDLAAAGVRWNQSWAGEMSRLLTETNTACHQARDEGRARLDPGLLAGFLSTYDALVEAGLAGNPTPAGRERNHLERKSYNIAVALRDRRAEATLFASDLSLPFTNYADRALRNPVVGRKNYYGSGSRWAAELAAQVWTITATASRADCNPLTYLACYLDACGEAGGRAPSGSALTRFVPSTATKAELAIWSDPLSGLGP